MPEQRKEETVPKEEVEELKERETENLPDMVKEKLPPHAQEIYLKAHDNALEQYRDPSERRGGTSESLEQVAHKVAWAAVKKEYRKDLETGQWVKKEEY